MATNEGWAADPTGTHEARYHIDGRPTPLVRDGDVESFDLLDGPVFPPDAPAVLPAAAPACAPPPPPSAEAPPPAAAPPGAYPPPSPPLGGYPPPPAGSFPAPPAEVHPPVAPAPGVAPLPLAPPGAASPPEGSYWVPKGPAPQGVGSHAPAAPAAPWAPGVSTPGAAWPPGPGAVGGGDPTALAGPSYPPPPSGDPQFFAAPRTAPPARSTKRWVAGSLAAVLVVVTVAVVVVAVGGSKSASATVTDAVTSALADRTADVTMHVDTRSSSLNVTATGAGAVDFTQNAMQLTLTASIDGQQVQVPVLYLGGTFYESVPDLDQVIPGKTWLSIDVASLVKPGALASSGLGAGGNPTAMLRVLAAQGNDVRPLGPSTVDGVAVQGYAVSVSPKTITSELDQGALPAWMRQAFSHIDLGTQTIRVYVDGSGRMRSYDMKVTETTGTAGKMTIDSSLDFSDYGTPFSATAPPASETVGFQQFLQAAQAAEGSSGSS